ncbi:ribonuclease P protein component [Patescibacteria group bacterium]|nr:ribonuclease P protein component [Patescibacteria group bacterium]
MPPSSRRISKSLFKDLVKHGRVLQYPSFRALFFFSSSCQKPRFAVVVSKKVAATAVLRNRIRRRIYPLLRPYYKIFPGLVAAFFIKTSKIGARPSLRVELDAFFEKSAAYR